MSAEAIERALRELERRRAQGEVGVSLQVAQNLLNRAFNSPSLAADKLCERARAYIDSTEPQVEEAPQPPSSCKPARPFAELIDSLQKAAPELPAQRLSPLEQQMQAQSERLLSEPVMASKPAVKADGLRAAQRFEQQRQRSQKRRTVEQALRKRPDDPGPLNPEMLAVEVLKELMAVSPAYLERQLSFIDALVQLEAMKLETQDKK